MTTSRTKNWLAIRWLGLAAVALFATGCAHRLEVKNIGLYKPTFVNSQQTGTRVGLSAVTSTPEEDRLVVGVANALKRDGFKIDYPFFLNDENRTSMDQLVKINTSSTYGGSGWNFLINWPGFLIWTPAWHGYDYNVKYDFDVDITNTKNAESLPRLSIPIDLDVRHAAMNRTWTEAGGWVAYSAIAFVGGIVFTRYDNSVTPILLDAVENKIADYVAGKIGATLISARHDGT